MSLSDAEFEQWKALVTSTGGQIKICGFITSICEVLETEASAITSKHYEDYVRIRLYEIRHALEHYNSELTDYLRAIP